MISDDTVDSLALLGRAGDAEITATAAMRAELPPDATAADAYWDDARRPLACLIFLLPLLAVYEIGVWCLAPVWNGIPRNGADAWLRGGLALLGLDAIWLLPAFVVGGLLTWHHRRGDRWQVSGTVLMGMFAESLLLAFALIIFGQLQDIAFQRCQRVTLAVPASVPDEYVPEPGDGQNEAPRVRRRPATANIPLRTTDRSYAVRRPITEPDSFAPSPSSHGMPRFSAVDADRSLESGVIHNDRDDSLPGTGDRLGTPPPTAPSKPRPESLWRQLAARTVLFIGAGVYEEFLFRFLLIPALIVAFSKGGVPAGRAALLAILWTSMLFSAAHYIGPAGDSFSLFTFLFRFAAGVFFASVFLTRGFGIVVGCHAAYDLLVGLMLPLAVS